jgi:predicted PurR-regulated permease PerM
MGADPDRPLRLAAPSLHSVVRVIAIVVGATLAVYLVWRVRDVLRLVVIAVFVALSLMPLVDRLDTRTRLPRAAAILALYLTLAGGVLLVGAVVVPSMAKQVGQIAHDAPHYVHSLRGNATFRRYDDRYGLTTHLQADVRALPSRLADATGSLQTVTVKAFGAVGQLVTVLSIAFLLLLHGREYVGMALRLTGPREARYRHLVSDINQAVAKYMLGNVAISVVATAATWLVLTLLGVPYALSLGVVVGLFDLIPLVGATLGALVVALSTATVDFPVATIVWVVFVILYQRFENYILQPLVYGRALDVNPLVTILAVLAGSSLLGILGALLAIPIAAAIQIVLRDWWSDRVAPEPSAP